MRAPALVFLLLSAGLALALGGCAAWTDYAETSPLRSPDGNLIAAVWRNQVDPSPFVVEVSAFPDTLARGESTIVTVTVINTLAVPAGVRFSNGCTSGWSLWSGRTCVASSIRACTMAPVQRVFAPGRMAPYSFRWTWDHDAVGPGTYILVAGLGVDGTLDGGEAALTLVDSRPGG